MAEKITGAQWEYLSALGESADENVSKADASALIEKAKLRHEKKPQKHQVRLAREWGVKLKPDATQRHATDALYKFIVARRWAYSVVRKVSGAEQAWRTYEDSKLPEAKMVALTHAVLADPTLASAAGSATRGSSFTGSAWNRYTAKATQAEAFLRTVALAQEHLPRELKQASAKGRSGCLGMAVLAISVALVVVFWMAAR